MFGYARCSTQHQDAIYEINELVKLGVKRENIYIDFNIWIPPEGSHVAPFFLCIHLC